MNSEFVLVPDDVPVATMLMNLICRFDFSCAEVLGWAYASHGGEDGE